MSSISDLFYEDFEIFSRKHALQPALTPIPLSAISGSLRRTSLRLQHSRLISLRCFGSGWYSRTGLLVRCCGRYVEARRREDLAGIGGTLDLSNDSITSLQAGDFDGLSALTTLYLNNNSLTGLPAGMTANLANLTGGTNYTYKAYSNSTCTTEVATETFTALKPHRQLAPQTNSAQFLEDSSTDTCAPRRGQRRPGCSMM